MAKAFAKSLGVEAEFVEIDWDNKIMELGAKTIDCVWNGMTLTSEVTSAMACSNAYCNNAQVVIVPADKASEYQTVESVKDLTFAAEAGSAGEAEVVGYFDFYGRKVENPAPGIYVVRRADGTTGKAVVR